MDTDASTVTRCLEERHLRPGKGSEEEVRLSLRAAA